MQSWKRKSKSLKREGAQGRRLCLSQGEEEETPKLREGMGPEPDQAQGLIGDVEEFDFSLEQGEMARVFIC